MNKPNVVSLASKAPEPGSMLDYALRYAAIGWHIFPVWGGKDGKCRCGRECKSPGKHPVENLVMRGQDQATTEPGQIRRWWALMPEAGIGVFLKPSGLIAIDIDPRNGGFYSMEIVEAEHGQLMSDVLQYTQGGGEHRVFKLAPDLDISLPGKLGLGVDVKRNGYIVLAPTHGVIGQYAWEASSDPLAGAIPSPLPDWIRDMVKPIPAAPVSYCSRHATPAQIAELRDALLHLPADDRETWVRFGLALCPLGQIGYDVWAEWSRKSNKFDPVDQIRVWRSFRPRAINFESIFFEAQQAGWLNPMAGNIPLIEVSEERVAELKALPAPPPAPTEPDRFIRKIPIPALQNIADWIGGLYESPTEEISQAGALALASVVAGRVYRSVNANWPSIMMVVAGSSGIGKNYIKVGVERLLTFAGLDKLISGDFYTHQAAIYWALHKAPCHICISDEFGENFLEARKNNNSNKLTVFKALKKVYSDADHIFKSENYAMSGMSVKQREENEMRPIVNPALTLMGLTTPMQFYSEIKTSHIESGLINRFIIVNVDNGNQSDIKRTSDIPPQAIIDLIRQVRRIDEPLRHTAHDLGPAPVVVLISKEAEQRFNDFKLLQDKTCLAFEAYGLDAMPRRWRENAMRLATAMAPWRDHEHPIIDAEIADYAIQYVQHYGKSVITAIRRQMGENDYQQNMNQVLQYICETKDGATDSDLARKFRAIKSREMVDIKNHLVSAELIYQEKILTGNRGRPTVRWVPVLGKEIISTILSDFFPKEFP